MKRRKYDDEFKRDAVELVIRSGRSSTEVGKVATFRWTVGMNVFGLISSRRTLDLTLFRMRAF